MGFGREVANIFNVIASPTEVFQELTKHPRWRAPALFTLAASIIVGWFMIPALQQPLRGVYARSFGSAGGNTVIPSLMNFYFMLNIGADIVAIGVRWVVISLMLYGLVRIYMSYPLIEWKQAISLIAYSEVVFVAMSVVTVLVLYAIGLDKIEKPSDTVIFKGIDYFLGQREESNHLIRMLANFNVFSLWYVIVISSGMRVFAGLRRGVAVALSGVVWVCWSILTMLVPIITDSVFRVAA